MIKKSDLWLYAIIGAVVLWWIFGDKHATVDLGPNAQIGGKTIDTTTVGTGRTKGGLEVAPYEAPPDLGPAGGPPGFSLEAWLATL